MTNQLFVEQGQKLLDFYWELCGKKKNDPEKNEDYVLTDAIASLLHVAHFREPGSFDLAATRALGYVVGETTLCEFCKEEHDPDLICDEQQENL